MKKLIILLIAAACAHAQDIRQISGSGGSVAGAAANANTQTMGLAGQNVIGNISGGEFGSGSGFAEILRSPILLDAPNGPEPLPTEYSFPQNYPNPFNPSTTFEFSLPKASSVELSLYDLLGRKTDVVLQTTLPAGHYTHHWQSPPQLSSGVYFAKFDAGEFHSLRKIVLLK
jgi:hypothetical protein